MTIIVQDLTEEMAADQVFSTLIKKGLVIDLLINNAGFGDDGDFAERPLEKQYKMIELNVLTPVRLTYLFLQGMRERQSGGIINVASIAGFQPMPYLSIYGATKAFLLSFSEAIWAENKEKGIKVLALCPGPTESNFFETAEFPQSMASNRNTPQLTPAKDVAKAGLEALEKNECVVVTGGIANQLIVNLNRFLPRSIIAQMMKSIFGERD